MSSIARLPVVPPIEPVDNYYNQALGDTSFLLSGILGFHLSKMDEWDQRKWLEDSLLRSFELKDNTVKISGVIIWGKDGTTEQWTDPFHFELEFNAERTGFKSYTFLFGDISRASLVINEDRSDPYLGVKQKKIGSI